MNSKKSKKTNKGGGEGKARLRGGRQLLVVGLVALVLAAGYYRWTLGNIENEAVSVSSSAGPESASPAETAKKEDAETFWSKDKDNDDKENSDDNNNNNNENNNGGGAEQSGENDSKQSDPGSIIIKARQDRDRLRGETMDRWKEIAANSDASESAKKEAEDSVLRLTEYSEQENAIETNVKSKGFDDCFAQVTDSGVSVIVKGGSTDSAAVAQIKDIIIAETGAAASKIKISAE